jgi:hypothetical protein
MSRIRVIAITVLTTLVVLGAILLIAGTTKHPKRQTASAPRSTSTTTSRTASRPAGRPQITTAIDTFAASYARFLNGSAGSVLAGASVTAAGQAQQAGQIPTAFRDGVLRITGESSLGSTCCSAQETIVLSNRQERYPFTVTLLDDGPHGWQVSEIVPVDLAMDRNTHPVTGFKLPAGAQRAATAFAIAYVQFKAGTGPEPTAMTAAAAKAIAEGQDSLAGQVVPKAAPVLEKLAYGPPTGSEFAATATVKAGRATETFTFLMTRDHGVYEAAEFL